LYWYESSKKYKGAGHLAHNARKRKIGMPSCRGARLINLAARPQWVESQGTSHSRGIVYRRKKPQSREKAGVAL
jgi:hypothetical protein